MRNWRLERYLRKIDKKIAKTPVRDLRSQIEGQEQDELFKLLVSSAPMAIARKYASAVNRNTTGTLNATSTSVILSLDEPKSIAQENACFAGVLPADQKTTGYTTASDSGFDCRLLLAATVG